jgi:homoserine dehydrogenase
MFIVLKFGGSVLTNESTLRLTENAIGAALQSRWNGEMFRHVAMLSYVHRQVAASVRLCPLKAGDPLAGAEAEHNSAVIEWADGAVEHLRGKGAGRWPTAEAIVADVLEIARLASSVNAHMPPRTPRE